MTDPEPLTHRRPQEALRESEPSDVAADQVTSTDPAMLAAQVPRSSLYATSSTPAPPAPRVPAGGSDPTSDGDDDPISLARQVLRRHF